MLQLQSVHQWSFIMKKKFDCVKMKHDIQEKLHKEMKGLSLREKMEYLSNKKITDSILQKFIHKNSNYDKILSSSFIAAEKKAEYNA